VLVRTQTSALGYPPYRQLSFLPGYVKTVKWLFIFLTSQAIALDIPVIFSWSNTRCNPVAYYS